MKRLLVLFLLTVSVCMVMFSQATRILVPQDYSKIQLAINAAVDGDTILVDHGIYYENIRFRGKKITIASRFIIDSDTSHISKTIIDGSSPSRKDSAAVVTFDQGTDSLSQICGFTIRGGKGNNRYDPSTGLTSVVGGGIDLFGKGGKIIYNQIFYNEIQKLYSSAAAICAWDPISTDESIKYIIIEHNIIAHNSLSGVYAEGGALAVGMSGRITSNIITDNNASGSVDAYGGGISIWGNSKMLLANNIIARNSSSYDAGAMVIYTLNDRTPDITLVNNTICYNTANQGTEGISGDAPLKMMNNIVWNPGDGPEIVNLQTIGYATNLIRGGYYGTDIIDADPLFADTILYRLSVHSPAVGRGSAAEQLDGQNTDPPTSDLLNNVRPNPIGTNPDLGAIESEFDQTVAAGPHSTFINRYISNRNTRIFLPRRYNATQTRFPLLIFLHGSGGNSTNTYAYGFHLVADTMNFIIASPKSLLPGWEDPSEMSFIETLIDTLAKDYRVDPDNIFLAGYSSGGFMSYRFGLSSRKKIKGIGSVAGLLQQDDAGIQPASHIALISFHSTDDKVVSYSAAGRPGYWSAESSVFKWLSYYSCGTTFDTLDLNDSYPQNSNPVQRLSNSCLPAVFYKISGGSHAYPGPYITGHRPTIPDVNATVEIMSFFRTLTITSIPGKSVDHMPQAFNLLQNYPNPFNPTTTIRFDLPVKSKVRLHIFNLLGQQVAELANEEVNVGYFQKVWNANVASGLYFYRLEAVSLSDPNRRFVDVKKMLLLK